MNQVEIVQRSFLISDSSVRRSDRRLYHTMVLTISCLVLVLAFVLEERDHQRVGLRGGIGTTLPQVCAMRGWFGMNCPACGLTRSFIRMARGAFAESFSQHRLGWLFVFAVLIQIPYRVAALTTGDDAPWGQRIPHIFVCSLVVLLMANWVFGLIVGS